MATSNSQTKYGQTILQEYPANDRTHWIDTYRLRSQTTTYYASTNKISGTSGNRPKVEKLRLKNFGFNLPEHAIITSIKVSYSHRIQAHTSGKNPSIGQPEIRLKNMDLVNYPQMGLTPKTDWVSKSLTWSSDNYFMPTVKQVNAEGFGVEFAYPKNANSNEGYVHLRNVTIQINYLIPEFPVELVAIGNENDEFVKDTPFILQAIVNNPDLADNPPKVEITVPSGTTLEIAPNFITSDTLTKISDTKYLWTLEQWGITNRTETTVTTTDGRTVTIRASQYGASTIPLQATIDSTGSKTFTITEQLNNATKSKSITVIAQATPIVPDTEIPYGQVVYAIQNSDFTIPVQIPASMLSTQFYLVADKSIQIKSGSSYTSVSANTAYSIPSSIFDETGYGELTAKTSNTGIINMGISNVNSTDIENANVVVKVVPAGYTIPRYVILKVSNEECNRLGDTYNYTLQADMRITCLAANVSAFVDYYRNFRLGVVNSMESTLNFDSIFNACRNWSDGITVFNEFERESVEFTYHKEYPVYIIITGNYDTATCNLFEGEFGNLQLIEKDRDDGVDVIFPMPIKNLITDNEDSISNLALPSADTSNNLIFYNLGLEDTFTGKKNIAVRGVAVRVTASSDESCVLSAKLRNPDGETGERSIILENTSNVHVIGDSTDRWGFNISELTNLNSFELELSVTNLAGIENNVSFEKVEVIPYFIFYEPYLVDWLIEGENMAGFNCFLQDVNVPEGLKTSTKYLSVDGTDTNNAFLQNIREKEITVEFDIDECNINESTATLQDVTEMLMTERDDLYRPIPKRLEFSHYPGIFWEYILEDTIDAEADGSSYHCKAKLTIPAGTAYTKEDITTGKAGRVAGLAKVNPIVIFKPTSSSVEISERFSHQKFVMSYDSWTTNDMVEIDCKNRKIYLHQNDEVIDISTEADMNTDWFLLHNQFVFEESGCVIQSVTWNERK